MIPTVSEVFEAARSHLGDTAVSGGQIAKDNLLQRFWPSAYSALFSWLQRNSNKRVRRTKFFKLPANTGFLSPASMGILDMGEPQEIFDRSIDQSLSATVAELNAASAGVPASVDLTATAHGLSAGIEVVAYGFDQTAIGDRINDEWFISVPDANTIRLNGCDADDLGSAVGTAGVVETSVEDFPSDPVQQLFDWNSSGQNASNSTLRAWKWEGDAFRFVPVTTARQIKIVYTLSGNAPTGANDSVGVDDSLPALSLFLAAMVAQAKGFRGKAQDLFLRAVGNAAGDTTMIRGGAFYELAQLGMKPINKAQVVMPRYRRKRNVGPIPYGGWL